MPFPALEFRRTLKSRLEELPLLADELEAWALQQGMALKLINSLNLLLDEVISNIVKYGYENQPDGSIELLVHRLGPNIEAIVRDYAPPFNLLETAAPDVAESLETRPVGGLGIYLIRQLADEISYRRDGEANEVTLRKAAI